MPELEDQINTEEVYDSEADVVEEADQADETEVEETVETEAEATVEEDAGREDTSTLQQQNAELQRRIVQLIEAQTEAAKPKQVDQSLGLRDILAKRFDDATAEKLAESFAEYEGVLAKKFAPREELQRMTGTLASLARNADEARVFEDMRTQGVSDKDIKDARRLVDRMVNDEGAYFPNAQVAMDAAYGRLNRERAKRTATATSTARAEKTAKRGVADMGHNRGGAGVPTLTDEEKAALYKMDTADFLNELDKRGYGKK